METAITDLHRFFRELLGLFLIFWAILLFLALATFSADDPSFNLVKSGNHDIQNMAGLFGAYAAGFLNDLFGVISYIWPLVFAALGATYLSARYAIHWWKWCGLFLLTLCLLEFASAFDFSLGDLSGGGMVGHAMYYNGTRYLSPVGTFIIWLFILLVGIQLLWNFSWINLGAHISHWLRAKCSAVKKDDARQQTAGKLAGYLKLPQWKMPVCAGKLKKLFQWTKKLGKFHLAKFPAKKQASPYGENPAPGHVTRLSDMTQLLPETPAPASEKITLPPPPPVTAPQPPVMERAPIEKNDLGSDWDKTEENETDFILSDDEVFPEDMITADEDGRLFHEEEKLHYPLPPASLLVPADPLPAAPADDYETRGKALISCLNDFGIQCELVRITPGPIITMYEVRPAPGVRVSRITNLSEDLSLAMKAVAIRIQPVLGSNTLGIEIPNNRRETVNFRELVESPSFQDNTGPLTIILGKTLSGQPYLTDLTKMPHLLVGGTTGAGKSVSLNAMLISLLYKLQPDELKLLLIDPKRVEMAVYADLPHLVHPVVTEMSDAKTALEWAIHEMQNRFDTIKKLGVRNVAAYNQRLATCKDSLPPDFQQLKPIPYLVIVIDELADLMMTAARDVETSILRLLQLARAAAIHLILATQRPSVDVVTGLLKANLNCRIAFQVISRHDSRTILDETGAEHLLGKGDMLFKPPAGALKRLHAPFLSDDEIQTVVNYWKQKHAPDYAINFAQWTPPSTVSSSGGGGSAATDPLYPDARAFVLEQGKASISLLQRHLKIGFNRAARIIEQFEIDGIVTPADGSKPRTVIRN